MAYTSSLQPVNALDDVLHKTQVSANARGIQDFDRISDDIDFHDDYHGHLRRPRSTQGHVGDDDDHGFTRDDKREMKRMGKKQELRRNFRPLSTIAFTVILQGTWEVLLAASTQGMVDGGLAGLFWSYMWTFIGFSLVMLSLAEMASMAPTSGGKRYASIYRSIVSANLARSVSLGQRVRAAEVCLCEYLPI